MDKLILVSLMGPLRWKSRMPMVKLVRVPFCLISLQSNRRISWHWTLTRWWWAWDFCCTWGNEQSVGPKFWTYRLLVLGYQKFFKHSKSSSAAIYQIQPNSREASNRCSNDHSSHSLHSNFCSKRDIPFQKFYLDPWCLPLGHADLLCRHIHVNETPAYPYEWYSSAKTTMECSGLFVPIHFWSPYGSYLELVLLPSC